ncbi:hypothetical protein J2X01_004041 [Arthrobacter ginsengisoli]|uniref:Resolvase/invertase-type recombinase catalytic domain-containing protein n=1 Tax=Arthrobacter ginsengisoli TaxID=1356565 RepID=A0ABU1UHW4_9MICC|nr:hypothetical protein [Arthrobacter ginsengisoli]
MEDDLASVPSESPPDDFPTSAQKVTADQNTVRQLEGIELDRVFTDKASGRDTKRPQLEELLRFLRDGDTLVVHSMDRLARNLDDLRSLVQRLTNKGVRIEFLKEQLVFTGEDSPLANLMLSVMGAFAEFERALIGVNDNGKGSPWPRPVGFTADAERHSHPDRQGSCGGGPARGSRRPPSPVSSASAAKPSISTSGQEAKDSLSAQLLYGRLCSMEVSGLNLNGRQINQKTKNCHAQDRHLIPLNVAHNHCFHLRPGPHSCRRPEAGIAEDRPDKP